MSAKKSSGHEEPPSHQETIESIVKIFSQNLQNALLGLVERKKVQRTTNSNPDQDHSTFDENRNNEKAKKRHISVDMNEGAKRICSKEKESHPNSEDIYINKHSKILPVKELQINLEKYVTNKTLKKDDESTKMSDASNKKSTNVDRKTSSVSSKDTNLKYRCSFCSDRFATLVAVRDHTRAYHKEANELRKAGKYKGDIKDSTSPKEDGKIEPKVGKEPNAEPNLLYVCKACKFASISYDCIIEHCQDHIIKPESLKHREIYRIKYLGHKHYVDFDTYNQMKNILDINSYIPIYCDYKLLKDDKWPGIFDMFTKPEIDRINCASIYHFTRIIRLSSPQNSTSKSSAPFMLFQCKRCNKYVDPHSIVLHTVQNSCHEKLTSYPCYDCQRPFSTESAMYVHYMTHKVAGADMKYRKIWFNDNKDFRKNMLLLKATGFRFKDALAGRDAASPKPSLESRVEEQKKEKTCPRLVNDARTMIIQNAQSEGKNDTKEGGNEIANYTVEERVGLIYKCRCGLCYHSLETLFKHLENCHDKTMFRKRTCICGLDFDETQYNFHHNMHCQGFTTLNVKRVTVSDEQTIDVKNMQHLFKENSKPKHNIIKEISNREQVDEHTSKIRGNSFKSGKKDQGEHSCEEKQIVVYGKTVTGFSTPILKQVSIGELGSKKLEENHPVCNAVCTKQDELTNASVLKLRMTPKFLQISNESSTKVANTKQIEAGRPNLALQSDNNINISETNVDNVQPIIKEATKDAQNILSSDSHALAKIVNRKACNTEDNQSMVDTIMDVELKEMIQKLLMRLNEAEKNNIAIPMKDKERNNTLHINEPQKTLTTMQAKEVIETQTEKNDLNGNINGDLPNESGQSNVDDKIQNMESNQDAALNKTYTEDELLNDPNIFVYSDVDDLFLTDDEDSIHSDD